MKYRGRSCATTPLMVSNTCLWTCLPMCDYVTHDPNGTCTILEGSFTLKVFCNWLKVKKKWCSPVSESLLNFPDVYYYGRLRNRQSDKYEQLLLILNCHSTPFVEIFLQVFIFPQQNSSSPVPAHEAPTSTVRCVMYFHYSFSLVLSCHVEPWSAWLCMSFLWP